MEYEKVQQRDQGDEVGLWFLQGVLIDEWDYLRLHDVQTDVPEVLNHLIGVFDDLFELFHDLVVEALEVLLFPLIEKVLYFFVEFFKLLHHHIQDAFIIFKCLGFEVALPVIVVKLVDIFLFGVDHRVEEAPFLVDAFGY